MKTLKIFTVLSLVIFFFTVSSGVSFAESVKKININTASEKVLTGLKKVGSKYAKRIVVYREKNGPFKKGEDIIKVSGIGLKIWDLNKDIIIVADSGKE